MENNYYIYFHINLVSNEVFYVGKGKVKRAWSKVGRSDYWKNIVNKYGYRVYIVKDGLTDEEAKIREIYYIKEIGRKDLGLGSLVNFTDGGEGVSGFKFNKESKQKMSDSHKGQIAWNKGIEMSQESKQKMSDSQKGNKINLGKIHSDQTKKKISESKLGKTSWNKGIKMSEETKKKLSDINKGKKISEETRKKCSEASKLYWQNKKNELQLITE